MPGLFKPLIIQRRDKTRGERRFGERTDAISQDETHAFSSAHMIFDESWRAEHRMIILAASSVSGAFYGGLHASKWNSQWFPTDSERFLWRISCCIGSVVAVPMLFLMITPFIKGKILRYASIAFGILFWSVFVAARIFIIFEAFLSLRRLPADAYSTVKWTNIILHI